MNFINKKTIYCIHFKCTTTKKFCFSYLDPIEYIFHVIYKTFDKHSFKMFQPDINSLKKVHPFIIIMITMSFNLSFNVVKICGCILKLYTWKRREKKTENILFSLTFLGHISYTKSQENYLFNHMREVNMCSFYILILVIYHSILLTISFIFGIWVAKTRALYDR